VTRAAGVPGIPRRPGRASSGHRHLPCHLPSHASQSLDAFTVAFGCTYGRTHPFLFAATWTPRAGEASSGRVSYFRAATCVARHRIGTLVTSLYSRQPVTFAKAAMTVDHLSGGRVELVLGVGNPSAGARAGGVDWPAGERVARFREFVELVDLLPVRR
jgi:hypothetical protein